MRSPSFHDTSREAVKRLPAVYVPDGSYEFYAGRGAASHKGETSSELLDRRGRLCVESSGGQRRCYKITNANDGYYMMTALGAQYRAQIP